MGMIENRRRVMMAQGGEAPTPTPSYGGIPIYADNCYFGKSDGPVTDVVSNNDWFLTGPIDSGSSSSKHYPLTKFGSSTEATARFYNDLTSSSADWWTIFRSDIPDNDIPDINSIDSVGRYIIVSIRKRNAADFWMKDANGNYLVKGNNVT